MDDEVLEAPPLQIAMRTLSAPTYDEVLDQFGAMPPGGHDEAAAFLRQHAETVGSHRPMAELALFLAERCEALGTRKPPPRERGGSGGGEGFPRLLRRACAAEGVLGAYRVLAEHRDLFPDEPVRLLTTSSSRRPVPGLRPHGRTIPRPPPAACWPRSRARRARGSWSRRSWPTRRRTTRWAARTSSRT
uniref:Uncharacterized protein n=1 Tax=Streptomyces sp. NBC_00008 TaxID=2903610 RepID=A0AAU2VN93_9ACTN